MADNPLLMLTIPAGVLDAQLCQEATVADHLAFEALSPAIQELARRVLGAGGVSLDAADAYEMGWEDAVEEMTFETPRCPDEKRIRERLAAGR